MNNHKRKLAAIVFTDIVGFTKLTAENQSEASILLTEQRNLLKPIVDSHGGSWLKEMGDGLLLIFDTVTDAVNCTIKIQEAAKKIEHLNLRIGIHQGEILLTDNDSAAQIAKKVHDLEHRYFPSVIAKLLMEAPNEV